MNTYKQHDWAAAGGKARAGEQACRRFGCDVRRIMVRIVSRYRAGSPVWLYSGRTGGGRAYRVWTFVAVPCRAQRGILG